MGESKEGPQGTQEDLDSSIISESQAAAMSPDYRLPVDPSLPPSLYLFLPLPLVDYGMVPGLWLLCYGRGQIQTHPHTLVHTDEQIHTRTHTHTCAHNNKKAQTHADGDGNWLISYLSGAHVPHTCKAFTCAQRYSRSFYFRRAKLPFRCNLSVFNLTLAFSSPTIALVHVCSSTTPSRTDASLSCWCWTFSYNCPHMQQWINQIKCFDAEQSSSTFHAVRRVLLDLVLMRNDVYHWIWIWIII